jgi:aspartate/methionine/tyrosine aminotransferase
MIIQLVTDTNCIHLLMIRNVCKRFNITVLSDEIYARLHYDANNYKSIANVCIYFILFIIITYLQYYPQGTIVTSGYSKWASAGGWRVCIVLS